MVVTKLRAGVSPPGNARLNQAAAHSDIPFANLDPARIVDAIESLGLLCDGRVLALNSYENRVFRVGIEDQPALIAKFYRPQRWSDPAIEEEHQFALELKAEKLPVVAPLLINERSLHHYEDLRIALFPLQGGRAPELDDSETLRKLGSTLAQMHNVGSRERFSHRLHLNAHDFGRVPIDVLRNGEWIARDIYHNVIDNAEQLLALINDRFEAVGSTRTIRLHGDCHLGNMLWRDDQPHFVDLDDAMNGPAIQDLWMLLPSEPDTRQKSLDALLGGYEQFRAFEPAELYLTEALRGLRLLHFHAWIARRWADPAFKSAFPFFADRRHWESVLLQLQEQNFRLVET